jgi:nucleoside-diphosphate-sugar epimerase
LIKISKAFAICYDVEHEESVLKTISLDKDIRSLKIPWISLKSLQESDITLRENGRVHSDEEGMGSVAFYFHSSGTTGLPKLISQTHNGAVGILPKLADVCSSKTRSSTFTTTPLYHGGIADLLRCWSAASPVWLFPEGKLPIVGPTVSSIIDRIDEISKDTQMFPASRLDYLSCVPYVLDALSKMPELKPRLCSLSAVGVGGASMSQELGDQLVADGVRLVSRFGSSECGFLVSSQRDYETDQLWNVHRCPDAKGFRFAPLSNGQYELIVTGDWPLVSTAVHAHRPLNTHDVFIPHQTIPNAWHYMGRSDSQLTLNTGKKFDPTEMEHILRRNVFIEDIIIIGDNKPFASAIIFASFQTDKMDPEHRCKEIWPSIQKVNQSVPTHARIEKDNFAVLDTKQYARVRKNTKGGVIRSAILTDFEEELSTIYGSATKSDDGTVELNVSENISAFVATIIQSVFGSTRNITREDELFDCGINSVMSLQIRKRICDILPRKLRSQVPLHIVYECGTISAITRYVLDLIAEDSSTSSLESLKRTKYQEMEDMVDKCVTAQPEMFNRMLEQTTLQSTDQSGHDVSVILTGSTGFLGVHILKLLLEDNRVSTVSLCVRCSNTLSHVELIETAKARVKSALGFHNILHILRDGWETKIKYIPFVLKEPCLGIPSPLFGRLISETTHVIHAAWEVNFNLPLKAFTSQVKGAIKLFNLALLASRYHGHRPATFIFCSSVASTANLPHTSRATNSPFLSNHPQDAAYLGYGQSKWVTENVLAKLSQQYQGEVDVLILRIGQLSGDTLNGIWNLREAWPLMVKASLRAFEKDKPASAKEVPSQNGSIMIPNLADTTLPPLEWLPVDYAAQFIWRIMNTGKVPTLPTVRILDVTNEDPCSTVTWQQAQNWISAWAEARHLHVAVTPPDKWLDNLESLPPDHRAKALESLWRHNWMPRQKEPELIANHNAGERDCQNLRHKLLERTQDQDRDMVETSVASYVLEKEYFWRLLDWVAQQ